MELKLCLLVRTEDIYICVCASGLFMEGQKHSIGRETPANLNALRLGILSPLKSLKAFGTPHDNSRLCCSSSSSNDLHLHSLRQQLGGGREEWY